MSIFSHSRRSNVPDNISLHLTFLSTPDCLFHRAPQHCSRYGLSTADVGLECDEIFELRDKIKGTAILQPMSTCNRTSYACGWTEYLTTALHPPVLAVAHGHTQQGDAMDP